MGQLRHNLFQVAVALKGQRVEVVRVVEPDGRHPVVVFKNEVRVTHLCVFLAIIFIAASKPHVADPRCQSPVKLGFRF
jgi:hypothetical protein